MPQKKLIKNKKNCRGPTPDPRQRGALPRAGGWALGKDGPPAALCRGLNARASAKPNTQSRRYPGPTPPRAPSLPRARPSAKMGLDPRQRSVCRGSLIAEGRPSAKIAFVECPRSGLRQNKKPSAVLLFLVVQIS